jgi:septal ring factor EnvC (AmiA/AmiB activator)
MCAKRSRHGLRLIVASFVLLVLVLSPLAAWPFSFGNQEAPAQSLSTSPAYPDLSTELAKEKASNASLKTQLKELESQVSASNKKLETLSTNLEKSGVKLDNTLATAESLLSEIYTLRNLLETSENSRIAMENEYDLLLADYQAKVDESNAYFQQATDATARYNALQSNQTKKRLVTTTIGSAAVYKEGAWGLDVTAGVNFGSIGVFGGAVYMFNGQDSFLKPADLMYKAGLTFTF